MEKSYIHVYTGNGKGKTTAALGISLRAVCAGKKVFFGQFVKGMKYSELKAPKILPNFKMEQFGRDKFIFNNPTQEDKDMAKDALNRINEVLQSNEYDLVILDEVNIALNYSLISIKDLLEIIDNRASNIEIILTGRYAPKEIIDKADLVTEMKEIKHYYKQGVKARRGIEN